MQIFRSIDSEATMGMDIDTAEAYKRGLVTSAALCIACCPRRPTLLCAFAVLLLNILISHAARGMIVDKGAQHAYIHAIRKAERFIYLENQCAAALCFMLASWSCGRSPFNLNRSAACRQVMVSIDWRSNRYFQGGSAEWGLRSKRELCPNLVPTEIALKAAAKIRARQPFAAYVLIPFWQVHELPSLCTPSVPEMIAADSNRLDLRRHVVLNHMQRSATPSGDVLCRSEGPPKSLSIQEVQYWCVTAGA